MATATLVPPVTPVPAAHPTPAISPAQQQLRTAQDLFIRRWGEMGQTWGINRTMAEIHALLYICGQPQCTDDVMERLNISRGNASMSLRALCDWGIIRRLHKRGERREYFESLSDVWEMFSIIAAERKRREMDPGLETSRQCQRMLDEDSLGKTGARSEAVQLTRQRLDDSGQFRPPQAEQRAGDKLGHPPPVSGDRAVVALVQPFVESLDEPHALVVQQRP